jgi:hypothetical protein
MGVTVHGVPGLHSAKPFEAEVGRALEEWLRQRPGDAHLFHDLTNLNGTDGGTIPPMGPLPGNIDHLVLWEGGFLLVAAKACPVGRIEIRKHGAVHFFDDGSFRRVEWLNSLSWFRYFGYVARLCDCRIVGLPMWVIPNHIDGDLSRARCLERGGLICSLNEVANGSLNTFVDDLQRSTAGVPLPWVASGAPLARDVERILPYVFSK